MTKNYFLYYILTINILEFILLGLDKYFAIKHKYRIPEIQLITITALGGSIGGLLGMYTFHHKTNKLKFKILYPLFLIIHLTIYFFI